MYFTGALAIRSSSGGTQYTSVVPLWGWKVNLFNNQSLNSCPIPSVIKLVSGSGWAGFLPLNPICSAHSFPNWVIKDNFGKLSAQGFQNSPWTLNLTKKSWRKTQTKQIRILLALTVKFMTGLHILCYNSLISSSNFNILDSFEIYRTRAKKVILLVFLQKCIV